MPTLLAALGYLLLTLLLTYPVSVSPATRALAVDADASLFLWTLGWDVHALVRQPLSIFDANIYYPERLTLAYSENLIGSALVAAPVIWLTDNPVLAANVVALLSCVLCGLGAYFLGRRLGLSAAAAFLAGLVFAFAPPRFLRISQLHLAVQWLPFALAFLHSYFDRGRPRDLRLAILCFSLQALSSGHGAVFAALAMAGLAIYRLLAGAPLDLARRMRDVGVPGALLIAPALLSVVPYLIVQQEMGLKRALGDYPPANATSFLASPTHVHRFVLSLFDATSINDTARAFLFPGYLPILLALVAFAPWLRANGPRARVFYLLVTVASVWLAAGPPIGLWPAVYWMPGLNFIRVPSRFTLLGVLGLGVLAAMGFERLSAPWRPRVRTTAAVVVGAMLVGEFAVAPLVTTEYRVDIPAVDRWLDAQPKPFAIAEVPVPRADQPGWERRQTVYMLHSMAHWQKTVHGYSGFRPPRHELLFRQLRNFPDEESLEHLRRLGVRYVVVHEDYYQPTDWPVVEERLRRFEDGLRLEHQDGAGRVYSLR